MLTGQLGAAFWWILAIIIAFFAILLIYSVILFFMHFSKELRYINEEIRRTEGAEKRLWKRRKRKLWLSLLPFTK